VGPPFLLLYAKAQGKYGLEEIDPCGHYSFIRRRVSTPGHSIHLASRNPIAAHYEKNLISPGDLFVVVRKQENMAGQCQYLDTAKLGLSVFY